MKNEKEEKAYFFTGNVINNTFIVRAKERIISRSGVRNRNSKK